MQQITEHIGHKVVLRYQDPEHGEIQYNVRIADCKKRNDGHYDVTIHHGGCLLQRIYSEYIVAVGSSNTALEKPL